MPEYDDGSQGSNSVAELFALLANFHIGSEGDNWTPIGGWPETFSGSADNGWHGQFGGDASNIKIDPRKINASQRDVLHDIAKACKLTGCNIETAIRIAIPESGLRANAQNPYGTAAGTFQLTAETARNTINRILPRVLPHTPEGEALLQQFRTSYNPYDPMQNAILGTALIKYNHDRISGILGHEAEAWQDYMMHFRPATMEALAKDPSMANRSMPANVVAANPGLPANIGQLAENFRGKMSTDVSGLVKIANEIDTTNDTPNNDTAKTSANEQDSNPPTSASPDKSASADRRVPGQAANNAYVLLTQYASKTVSPSATASNTTGTDSPSDTHSPNYKVVLATETAPKGKDAPKLTKSPSSPIVAA